MAYIDRQKGRYGEFTDAIQGKNRTGQGVGPDLCTGHRDRHHDRGRNIYLVGAGHSKCGTSAIISFGLAALVSLFTALSYCEFVSIYPRSGEGYLYTRKTFSAPLAYLVGFCLFLGCSASCSFYIASLSSYFVEFIMHTPLEIASGIVVLLGLAILNVKGTKESGKFQIFVTAAKVILLAWFIVGGIRFVQTTDIVDKISTDVVAIAQTSALIFITFFWLFRHCGFCRRGQKSKEEHTAGHLLVYRTGDGTICICSTGYDRCQSG